MKIIENLRFLNSHGVGAVRLLPNDIKAISDEFAVLETQLKAEKVRSKLFSTKKEDITNHLDNIFDVIRVIPGTQDSVNRIQHAMNWISESKVIRDHFDNLNAAYNELLQTNGELQGKLFTMRSALRESESKNTLLKEQAKVMSAAYRLSKRPSLKGLPDAISFEPISSDKNSLFYLHGYAEGWNDYRTAVFQIAKSCETDF